MPTKLEGYRRDQAGERTYRAFLIRCWLEGDPHIQERPGPDLSAQSTEKATWRFTLVQLNGKQAKKGFASIEELCAYLKSELTGVA